MQNNNIFQPFLNQDSQTPVTWTHLNGASMALAIANASKNLSTPLLIIAPDTLTAYHLEEELRFFAPDLSVLQFPDWETLPYDHFSPHQDIISARLAALTQLPRLTHGAMITTVSTLLQRLAPVEFFHQTSFLLNIGDNLNIDILRTRLTNAGYHAAAQVREHGEFSIRGSLIDLFPMGSHTPFRIDLLDNEVDTIRTFSPDTQRTLEKISAIHLLPAKEFPVTETAIEHFRQAWRSEFSGNPLKSPYYQDISEGICFPGIEYYLPLFFDHTDTFFSYLPKNSLIFTIGKIDEPAQSFWQEINERYTQGRHDITRPLLAPEKIFLKVNELKNHIAEYAQVCINANEENVKSKNSVYAFPVTTAPGLEINANANVPLQQLKLFLQQYPGRTLFCVETVGRREVLLQLFNSIHFTPTIQTSWQDFLTSNTQHNIVVAEINQGFCLTEPPIALLTEMQLYGKRVMQRRLRSRKSKFQQDPDSVIRDLTELQINDPVVHIQHGIGKYLGLQTLTVSGQIGEFLTLEYQGGDKLYVPVAALNLISRYTGANEQTVAFNKLGTDHWQKAKRRAAEKVKDVAAELLDLYAKRASRPGHLYQLPTEQYESFAANFPFEETPDQLNAIQQVFQDMTSEKPMDRVICGDVGFGKTEVAMRAAFLAVNNGKQVVVLVPTTLLAQQHYENFQNRFAESAISVEVLSRFRTAKQQKTILEKLAEGKIDIIIGTHKLIQSGINFKDLGLVIIDEEHRFGVKQKERLKALRAMVDILTLTATPIPRTLNMALAGIRDLSVIATPPARRLSVKTFIHEYQESIIIEAIQREILRGGQVFFLHNDITSINRKAEELKNLVREARVGVAHGQMHERELERIMSAFYHRQFNVLVCSTIIESGIDIPTANTIIINRADKFGIAQLHQLRGRVGRSHHQAYAYLLAPPRDNMTADAQKRLDAISSLDDLGIGFTLATHDLEIRGAGELLGEEQSGNMHEIGFTLYMDLLSRAVDALKAGKEADLEDTLLENTLEIDLHLPALIPETYLNDVQIRLQFYKRIANAKTEAALDELQVEMIDRFGLLPAPLKNLYAIHSIKLTASELGIIKLDANEKGGKIEFSHKPNIKPETVIKLIQAPHTRYKLEGSTRLRFGLESHNIENRINLVAQVLADLRT
jgi:transcription-repair coupling factor (superfamily II helicase)